MKVRENIGAHVPLPVIEREGNKHKHGTWRITRVYMNIYVADFACVWVNGKFATTLLCVYSYSFNRFWFLESILWY